ncbi:2780_t:CDS:1, partial [Acaulospora colombiana]
MVIDVPYVFDTCCDSKDFHRFIDTFSGSSIESVKIYALSEKERKNLRLVCKAWAELAPQAGRWVSSVYHPTGARAKRFDVTTHKPHATVPELHEGSHLSTLCIHISPLPESVDYPLQTILQKTHSLHSIRAFSLTNKDTSPYLSLRELQTHFASLTTLYIETVELYGPLRLDKLEVLYWNIENCDKEQWWFPSLRHCALGDRVIGINKFQSSLVPGPTHQL